MSKIVVGLYDQLEDAKNTRDLLKDRNFDDINVYAHKDHTGFLEGLTVKRIEHGDAFDALVDGGVPRDDAELYAEGVRRGSTLVFLTCEDVRADEVADIMGQFNLTDIKPKEAEWRQMGWTGYDRFAPGIGSQDKAAHEREVGTEGASLESRHITSEAKTVHIQAEQVFVASEGGVSMEPVPLDEPYGKTEFIEEEPILLSEGYADPGASEALFGEQKPDIGERVQAALHERIKLEEQPSQTLGSYEGDFRQHFEQSVVVPSLVFEDYATAYSLGLNLAEDEELNKLQWSDLEPEIQRQWEVHRPGTWVGFKDAVFFGYDLGRKGSGRDLGKEQPMQPLM